MLTYHFSWAPSAAESSSYIRAPCTRYRAAQDAVHAAAAVANAGPLHLATGRGAACVVTVAQATPARGWEAAASEEVMLEDARR